MAVDYKGMQRQGQRMQSKIAQNCVGTTNRISKSL